MKKRNESEGRSPTWRVFDEWTLFVTPNQIAADRDAVADMIAADWDVVADMISAFAGVSRNLYAQIDQLLTEWDRILVDFGGDPTHQDWRRFRPLRLSREEDWSDWLAYLIECSDTGAFSCALLADAMPNRLIYARPKTTAREVAHGDFRADVVVQWTTDNFTHIEVKVGDRNLSKTLPTSRAIRERYGRAQGNWFNYILLLSPQIPEWEAVDRADAGEPPVKAMTWDDVCVALRRALRSDEKLLWKAFAYALVGAIEQSLVGYAGYNLKNRPVENLESKLQILRGGLLG